MRERRDLSTSELDHWDVALTTIGKRLYSRVPTSMIGIKESHKAEVIHTSMNDCLWGGGG